MSQDVFFIQRFGQEQGPLQLAELQMMARSGQIKATTLARREGGQLFQVGEIPGVFSDKDWITALLLSLFLGWFGHDRIYLGHVGLGVVKFLTFGGCGFWTLIDIILIAVGNLRDSNDLPLKK